MQPYSISTNGINLNCERGWEVPNGQVHSVASQKTGFAWTVESKQRELQSEIFVYMSLLKKFKTDGRPPILTLANKKYNIEKSWDNDQDIIATLNCLSNSQIDDDAYIPLVGYFLNLLGDYERQRVVENESSRNKYKVCRAIVTSQKDSATDRIQDGAAPTTYSNSISSCFNKD